MADELRRVTGSRVNAGEQLQRWLSELDQQSAKLRDHFKATDPQTALDLGLYDEAKRVTEERKGVELELDRLPASMPALPDAVELRERASAAFDQLEKVLAGGTVEEKRELVGLYVEKIKADPDTESVQISFYPSPFNRAIGGRQPFSELPGGGAETLASTR